MFLLSSSSLLTWCYLQLQFQCFHSEGKEGRERGRGVGPVPLSFPQRHYYNSTIINFLCWAFSLTPSDCPAWPFSHSNFSVDSNPHYFISPSLPLSCCFTSLPSFFSACCYSPLFPSHWYCARLDTLPLLFNVSLFVNEVLGVVVRHSRLQQEAWIAQDC